ncbi:MAG TPA: hypothetical protein VHZ55_21445 [Bryobacteraceae bacterium]|nr:hypothetical protein [Bryobacteraceae bacterium]
MKNGRIGLNIALIVASGIAGPVSTAFAADPPPDLLRRMAARETENAKALSNYTYRQIVVVQEYDNHGQNTGEYRETRDIIFSPTRGRYEEAAGAPRNTLTHIKLTPEDFADIRDIDPFLLTSDKVALYHGQYKGEETVDGFLCFVEDVRPRQILAGQRFFEGLLWARESDFAILKSQGQAVPQIETLKEQNLTPHFTTIRQIIDGKWVFPTETYADDTLYFRDWPQRIRIEIRYMNYKQFGAESTVTYGSPQPPPANRPAPPPPSPQPPPVPQPPHH